MGRYEAGQKQKIAEAFHVSVMLDDIYFSPGTEAAAGSIQPVDHAEWLGPPIHLLRILQDEDLVVDPLDGPTKVDKEVPPQQGLFD